MKKENEKRMLGVILIIIAIAMVVGMFAHRLGYEKGYSDRMREYYQDME